MLGCMWHPMHLPPKWALPLNVEGWEIHRNAKPGTSEFWGLKCSSNGGIMLDCNANTISTYCVFFLFFCFLFLAQIEKINCKGNPKYNQPGQASANRVEIKKWCNVQLIVIIHGICNTIVVIWWFNTDIVEILSMTLESRIWQHLNRHVPFQHLQIQINPP